MELLRYPRDPRHVPSETPGIYDTCLHRPQGSTTRALRDHVPSETPGIYDTCLQRPQGSTTRALRDHVPSRDPRDLRHVPSASPMFLGNHYPHDGHSLKNAVTTWKELTHSRFSRKFNAQQAPAICEDMAMAMTTCSGAQPPADTIPEFMAMAHSPLSAPPSTGFQCTKKVQCSVYVAKVKEGIQCSLNAKCQLDQLKNMGIMVVEDYYQPTFACTSKDK
eukprot:gene4900-2366_t